MKGRILSDWNNFDFTKIEDRNKLTFALEYFCALPDPFASPRRPEKVSDENWKAILKKFREDKFALRGDLARIHELADPNDFPTSVLPLLQKYHVTTHYDNGYEQVFDVIDFSGSKRGGFDTLDVEDGLSFSKVGIGGEAKVYKMAGQKTTTYFDYYAGGLHWHRSLFDDEEWWNLEDNAIAFRNKAYLKRSQVFYALIEALGAGYDITWQNPDPATLANTVETYTANRDAQTMNAAAQAILLAVKDKGYGVDPTNTSFIVLNPLQLRGRVKKGLNLMMQATTGSERQIDYNFRQITTMMFSTTNKYYVILPKIKAKAGYRMDLAIFAEFDPRRYADTSVGWMRYGGSIGDSDQFRRCETA